MGRRDYFIPRDAWDGEVKNPRHYNWMAFDEAIRGDAHYSENDVLGAYEWQIYVRI